jgi:arginase family enzyme
MLESGRAASCPMADPTPSMSETDLFDDELFETDGAIYMASRRDPEGCTVGLFGVPYDGTTSFRPGTRFGPAAIREVSSGLETYCPQQDLDLEDLAFADLGAVAIPFGAPEPVVEAVRKATTAVLNLGLKPLMLGGEHSISSGAVAAVAHRHPDLVLVQLDAHADLRQDWLGTHHSHACAMRRCLANCCRSPSAAAPGRNSRSSATAGVWWRSRRWPKPCGPCGAGPSTSRWTWTGSIRR